MHHDAETGLICLESAVNLRFLTSAEAKELIDSAPARSASVLAGFDPRAESGSETRVRSWFYGRRVPVEPQAVIDGLGRVDMLVGNRLILECDSDAQHTGVHIAPDRQREQVAAELGYFMIRLSYQQIWDRWDETVEYLTRVIRSKQHRQSLKALPA